MNGPAIHPRPLRGIWPSTRRTSPAPVPGQPPGQRDPLPSTAPTAAASKGSPQAPAGTRNQVKPATTGKQETHRHVPVRPRARRTSPGRHGNPPRQRRCPRQPLVRLRHPRGSTAAGGNLTYGTHEKNVRETIDAGNARRPATHPCITTSAAVVSSSTPAAAASPAPPRSASGCGPPLRWREPRRRHPHARLPKRGVGVRARQQIRRLQRADRHRPR